jgi:hypothetical protein
MRERDRLAFREFQQFEQDLEAEERARAYEAKRPQREAGQHIVALRAEVDSYEQEKLLGKRRDPGVRIDGYADEVDKYATDLVRNCYNKEQIDYFKQAHPGEWTPELSAMIGNYFAVNSVGAASYMMLRHLVDRIRNACLTPQPKPTPAVLRPAPKQPAKTAPSIEPEKPTPWVGRDQTTGIEREFSQFEIERMSADTFKRTFQLIGENQPALLAARW